MIQYSCQFASIMSACCEWSCSLVLKHNKDYKHETRTSNMRAEVLENTWNDWLIFGNVIALVRRRRERTRFMGKELLSSHCCWLCYQLNWYHSDSVLDVPLSLQLLLSDMFTFWSSDLFTELVVINWVTIVLWYLVYLYDMSTSKSIPVN